MRSFKFREILLVSFKEAKARRIPFSPEMNVIKGPNGTGKSALLKSLYWTFGAEPQFHPSWKNADVRSAVNFVIDSDEFTVVRHGKTIAFFDAKGHMLQRCESVSNDVAPYFAKLVGFGLRLPNRDDKLVPLPPAYFFLPFYMDQDASWNKQWAPFSKLGQFPNWKKSVVEYHAGIRGNQYYEAKASKLDAEGDVRKLESKHDALQAVYDSLKERLDATRFDVNIEVYEREVEELLAKCERLRKQEEAYRVELVELRNQKNALETQLAIAKHALQEAKSDYEFASSSSPGEPVECPTCGANYDNSFAERFSIAMDEDRCTELLMRLKGEIDRVDDAIRRKANALKPVSDEIERIGQLLARREGEIQLVDILQQKGREELRDIMQKDLSEIELQQGQTRNLIARHEREMQLLDSKERRGEVNKFFRDTILRYLTDLDVLSATEDDYASVEAVVKETGSRLPRALLAYQSAMLDVILRYGTAAFAPIVIDSPNQQDQDPANLSRILQFISKHRPADSQLIVGMVDPMGHTFGGKEYVLVHKDSLLLRDEFEEGAHDMRHYVEQMLN